MGNAMDGPMAHCKSSGPTTSVVGSLSVQYFTLRKPYAEKMPDAIHPYICTESRRSYSGRTGAPRPCDRDEASQIQPQPDGKILAGRSDRSPHRSPATS